MNCAFEERAVLFECGGETLVAIASVPRPGPAVARAGLVIVVGGPQYRVGSHRQFALLARAVASRGIPALRFDCRGMGDSTGAMRSFEDFGPDIRAAVDRLLLEVPGLESVVLWGLCDAASAALMYAHSDPRIHGVVLANPWVRTEEGAAKAYLKHYYAARLADPEFWRKIARGRFRPIASLRDFVAKIARARAARRSDDSEASTETAGSAGPRPLPDRMLDALRRFQGSVLLVLSGQDLTAREFCDVTANSKAWRNALESASACRHDIETATHTFSSRAWRDEVADITARWVLEPRSRAPGS